MSSIPSLRDIRHLPSICLVLLLSAIFLANCGPDPDQRFQAGDVLFQDLPSAQAEAVRLATGSDYSHCGIVIRHNGVLAVCEAVQPVRVVSIDQWIAQGNEGRFLSARLTDRDSLTRDASTRLSAYCLSLVGKDYDAWFGWSDDRIYCSELVWKAYHHALGIDLTTQRKLSDYNFDHPVVQQKLAERYGENVPWDELMVSPGDLANSPLLRVVELTK